MKEFQEKRLLYDEVNDWVERQTDGGEEFRIDESSGEATDAKKKKKKLKKKVETDSGEDLETDESTGGTGGVNRRTKKAVREQLGEELETDDESVGEIINVKKKQKKQKKKKKKERREEDEVKTEIDMLNELIDEMKKYCKDEITKLEKKTKDMIHLVSNPFWKTVEGWIGIDSVRPTFRNSTWFQSTKHASRQRQRLA